MENKAIPIIIGTLLILIGGTYVALNQGEIIPDIELVEFDSADIQFIKENVEFVTSTDELDRVIKTGLRVPIKYNFPVATTTGYVVEEIDGAMEMTFDGYNMCRYKGGTKNKCLKELRDDITSNIETFQENVKRELEELKQQQFKSELDFEDL